jgi:CubicO group peptidase (beta-lactamase class C family)
MHLSRRAMLWAAAGSILAPRMLVARQADSSAASLLSPFIERNEVAGIVALVVDKSGVRSADVLGMADREAGRAMTRDSLFWIASMTKPITAVGVMTLVDEGKLSLDDPIEKYLPEFKTQMVVAEKTGDRVVLKKPNHPVTVRETLCHTSGMPFKSAVEEPGLDGLPLAAAVRSYAMTPLGTEPGTKFLYSNAGINTAARVAEVISGQSHHDFMQARLFGPLGMKDTTYWPTASQLTRLAKSYRPNEAKDNLAAFNIPFLGYPLDSQTARFAMPAGGLFSTADDVGQFCRMMLNRGEFEGKRIISEAAVAEMTRRQTPADLKENWGVGFTRGEDWFGHGGAHATNMEVHTGRGLAVVWMVQHGGFVGNGGQAQGQYKAWAAKTFAG